MCKNRPVDVQGAGDSDPSGSPASSSITCTSAPHVIPLHELVDVTRRGPAPTNSVECRKTRQVIWSLTRRFVRRGWLIREAGVTAVVVENPRLRGSIWWSCVSCEERVTSLAEQLRAGSDNAEALRLRDTALVSVAFRTRCYSIGLSMRL